MILFYAGYTDRAIALLAQLEATEPDFLSPHNYLAVIYLSQGNGLEYLSESRKFAMLLRDERSLAIVAAGEKGFARDGSHGMLLAILNEQQAQYANGRIQAYYLVKHPRCSEIESKRWTIYKIPT